MAPQLSSTVTLSQQVLFEARQVTSIINNKTVNVEAIELLPDLSTLLCFCAHQAVLVGGFMTSGINAA
jgi:hypothetical protein